MLLDAIALCKKLHHLGAGAPELLPDPLGAATKLQQLIMAWGKTAVAIELMQNIIDIFGRDTLRSFELASMLKTTGSYDAAVSEFRACIVTMGDESGISDGGKADVFTGLGQSLHRVPPPSFPAVSPEKMLGQDVDGAEKAFRAALALDRLHKGAHSGLGELLMHTGREEEAMEHLMFAVRAMYSCTVMTENGTPRGCAQQ